MLKLPVVPVALDSGDHWPKAFIKRPGTVTMRFGAPIPPGLPRGEIEARVLTAINQLQRPGRPADTMIETQ
jgi:1-acyl-sn-glycerol-3-phosphate acyltransferase